MIESYQMTERKPMFCGKRQVVYGKKSRQHPNLYPKKFILCYFLTFRIRKFLRKDIRFSFALQTKQLKLSSEMICPRSYGN